MQHGRDADARNHRFDQPPGGRYGRVHAQPGTRRKQQCLHCHSEFRIQLHQLGRRLLGDDVQPDRRHGREVGNGELCPGERPASVQQIPTLSKMGTALLAGLLALWAGLSARRRHPKG